MVKVGRHIKKWRSKVKMLKRINSEIKNIFKTFADTHGDYYYYNA